MIFCSLVLECYLPLTPEGWTPWWTLDKLFFIPDVDYTTFFAGCWWTVTGFFFIPSYFLADVGVYVPLGGYYFFSIFLCYSFTSGFTLVVWEAAVDGGLTGALFVLFKSAFGSMGDLTVLGVFYVFCSFYSV